MRHSTVGLAVGLIVLCAAPAAASPPVSREVTLPLAGKLSNYATTVDAQGAVPSVERGQALGIACADADDSKAQISVVMNVAQDEGAAPTGYDRVLLTEWRILHGTVHVRVPDMPALSNHTVDVKVFVTKPSGTHICDVGRVKIS
jgi:hypothetical protein